MIVKFKFLPKKDHKVLTCHHIHPDQMVHNTPVLKWCLKWPILCHLSSCGFNQTWERWNILCVVQLPEFSNSVWLCVIRKCSCSLFCFLKCRIWELESQSKGQERWRGQKSEVFPACTGVIFSLCLLHTSRSEQKKVYFLFMGLSRLFINLTCFYFSGFIHLWLCIKSA